MVMFNIIACINNKRGIGKNNQLPWKFPEDLKKFKELTTSADLNIVIMGRKTYDSIGKPLRGRCNIVVTSKGMDYGIWVDGDGTVLIPSPSLDDALACANSIEQENSVSKSIWVIGGQQLYEQAINHPELDKVYLTVLPEDYQCDRFFPEYDHLQVESKVLRTLPGKKWLDLVLKA